MISIYQIKGVGVRKIDPSLFIQKIIEEGTLHRFVFKEIANTKDATPTHMKSLLQQPICISCSTCKHLYTLNINTFLLRKKECVLCVDKIHNIAPKQNKPLLVSTVPVLAQKTQL